MTDSSQIVLSEQQLSSPIQLSAACVSAIAKFHVNVDDAGRKLKRRPVVAMATGKPGYYQLQTNSIVGSFSAGGVFINIVPKAGIGQTARLLAYTAGVAKWQLDDAKFDDTDAFVDTIVSMFVYEVENVVRVGLVEEYSIIEERGFSPKGRVRFDLAARQGISLPSQYEFDELSLNTALNRLLLRALLIVRELETATKALKLTVRKLILEFSNIDFEFHPWLFDNGKQLPQRVSHYKNAAALASLIVQQSGLEPSAGPKSAKGLLFDMNKVFEDFVVTVAQRKAPNGITVDVQGDVRALHLDEKRVQRIYPDFSLWAGSECRMIGDAKYKLLRTTDYPPRSDLYQVLSYMTAAGCARSLLVYTGIEQLRFIRFANTAADVAVLTIDLEQTIEHNEMRISRYFAWPDLVTAGQGALT